MQPYARGADDILQSSLLNHLVILTVPIKRIAAE